MRPICSQSDKHTNQPISSPLRSHHREVHAEVGVPRLIKRGVVGYGGGSVHIA